VANDPMKQFEIKKILELPQIAGQDISFTNSSLWMVVGISAIILFFEPLRVHHNLTLSCDRNDGRIYSGPCDGRRPLEKRS